MIISQTAEYALRAAACIAVHGDSGPVRAKDLSIEATIPQTYLSKILRKLVEAELLIATKGHNGGFTLARNAKKIWIIDILNAVEPQMTPRQCIFGWRACNSKKPCLLHHRWAEVRNSFDHWIKSTSLEDIKLDAKKVSWLTNFQKPE